MTCNIRLVFIYAFFLSSFKKCPSIIYVLFPLHASLTLFLLICYFYLLSLIVYAIIHIHFFFLLSFRFSCSLLLCSNISLVLSNLFGKCSSNLFFILVTISFIIYFSYSLSMIMPINTHLPLLLWDPWTLSSTTHQLL